LFVDFRYRGVRCREQTALKDNTSNRKKLETIAERMEAEMLLGTFRYRDYFPDSPKAAWFDEVESEGREDTDHAQPEPLPTLGDFAETWLDANRVRWKDSQVRTVTTNLNAHILPRLGAWRIDTIDRAKVLAFRSELAGNRQSSGSGRLSNDRINHVMTTLDSMLAEAATRWGLGNPCADLDRLPVELPDVHPLSLDEVRLFLANVRSDFHDYFLVRFLTGLRTGEIDGLQWRYVDFRHQQIRVRETLVNGRLETPKNRHSRRDVDMSQAVAQALRRQYEVTGKRGGYVFTWPDGRPLDYNTVNRRVWTPTLRYIGLAYRRAYETRHTAATLYLAAGENPEWIARQLGHANTEMLFQRYSRYVPNLTRRDGTAFESLLNNHGLNEDAGNE
jgi:integrase